MNETNNGNWPIKNSVKDSQSITKDWDFSEINVIDGVRLKEVKNVPKLNGYLTEIFRQDWFDNQVKIDQVFQVKLSINGLSAWHAHRKTVDRLFVSEGLMRIVLYDDRPESPTRRTVNEFRLGSIRPGLVIVPPRVWHGVQNIGDGESTILNLVDTAYAYEDPDHWRLPYDSTQIPFSFQDQSSGDL